MKFFNLLQAISDTSGSVLEPSCGDGSFIEALANYYKKLGATDEQIKRNVLGIEQDEVEAQKASQYGATIICNDFFDYYQNNIDGRAKFDVIIGNPPYIRCKNFKEEQRKIAFDLIRIPMQMAERLDLQKIDDWQRKGEIDKILEYTDSVLLREGLGLNDDEIKMLRDIWDKLRNKRLSRNKK